MLRLLQGEFCREPDPERTARELAARDIIYEYPGDSGVPVFAQAPADPADEFTATFAFATDPEVIPGQVGRAPKAWFEEVSYLGDSLGPAG